ncbi:MAG: DNA-binding protein [Candidatus Methylomirabilia bacterium]
MIIPDVTVSLSDEEVWRLEELGGRVGLTVVQLIRLGVRDIVSQPDEAFHAAAQRVLEKNAKLYRRLA